jgi:hypothetical protein
MGKSARLFRAVTVKILCRLYVNSAVLNEGWELSEL